MKHKTRLNCEDFGGICGVNICTLDNIVSRTDRKTEEVEVAARIDVGDQRLPDNSGNYQGPWMNDAICTSDAKSQKN